MFKRLAVPVSSDHDIYVGRNSIWYHDDIESYTDHIRSNKLLHDSLQDLRGKVLAAEGVGEVPTHCEILAAMANEMVVGFFGYYRYFSNDYGCAIEYNGTLYNSVSEALEDISKQYNNPDEWVSDKTEILKKLLWIKFTVVPKLLYNNYYLVNINYNCDTIMGVCLCDKCRGNGRNYLGQLIMHIRDMMRMK